MIRNEICILSFTLYKYTKDYYKRYSENYSDPFVECSEIEFKLDQRP